MVTPWPMVIFFYHFDGLTQPQKQPRVKNFTMSIRIWYADHYPGCRRWCSSTTGKFMLCWASITGRTPLRNPKEGFPTIYLAVFWSPLPKNIILIQIGSSNWSGQLINTTNSIYRFISLVNLQCLDLTIKILIRSDSFRFHYSKCRRRRPTKLHRTSCPCPDHDRHQVADGALHDTAEGCNRSSDYSHTPQSKLSHSRVKPNQTFFPPGDRKPSTATQQQDAILTKAWQSLIHSGVCAIIKDKTETRREI